jgi:hypothetical protein
MSQEIGMEGTDSETKTKTSSNESEGATATICSERKLGFLLKKNHNVKKSPQGGTPKSVK